MKKTNNHYSDYKIQDFLTDESFIDWARGLSVEEDWTYILEQHPHLVPLAAAAKKQLLAIKFGGEEVEELRKDKLFNKVQSRISKENREDNIVPINTKYPQTERSKHFLWLAAVSIAILSLAGIAWWQGGLHFGLETKSGKYLTKETAKGQKLTAILSDGSKVMLNAGGKIGYREFFSDTARVVHLEGEAFFEVAKDKKRPFRVVTGKTVTTALGTSFNIREGLEDVAISLLTGKVGVDISDSEGVKVATSLLPGEQVVADLGEEVSFVKEAFNPDEVTAWQRDILLFKNASSREVFQKIELWYGVEIHTSDDSKFRKDWNYTGSFEGERLEDVLASIGFVKGFNYSIKKNNQVYLN
ncbi:FecR family protein [Echinicola rosea]|uniref:FecR family protein n=1 Tax=Echinicola rosea TaxID=1807691 RepID=A0ABQ1UJ66_9BACT|nr:FecR family protein [Echinicola rosea]GGF18330.1 hypothetical protein GCM10011339_02820 [Echinicola rosea]